MPKTKKIITAMSTGLLLSTSGLSIAAEFTIQKFGTGFSLNGGSGGTNGRQLSLYPTINHVNLTWVQIDRGNGYYSYKKKNTNYCIDGGGNGANKQAVKLWTCSDGNQNQHWKKIKITSGTENYRLEKRNASGYSIDGGGGASQGQTVHLWGSNGGNVNQQWTFIRRDNGSPTPTPTPTTPTPTPTTPTPTPSNCNVPHDAVPMDYWKVNIPFSSANGGSDGNSSKSAEIDWSGGISSYERSPYFTNSGCDYVQFRAHAGGATTGGSGYPRSELREMDYRGNEASWSSTSGKHTLEVDLRVTNLPSVKPHVVIAQIHDGDDDVVTFRLEGNRLMMEIDGSDGPTLDSSYSLGERITVGWVVENGQSKAYYNGNLVHTLNKSYSGAYFKTGAYTQSACGGDNKIDGESCSAYGEVEIFDINLNHN